MGLRRVVVLCDVGDLAALWAARELERRGIAVEVVSGPVLSCALAWEHRLNGAESALACVRLPDGRELSSAEPVPVLNRLSAVWTQRFDAVADGDKEYAVQELQALVLSWLHALPGPVVNRPTPQGLCGAWRHPSEWALLAAQAGLAAPPYRQTSADPFEARLVRTGAAEVVALVVGERVVPSRPGLPADVLEACARLGSLAGTRLLGVELAPGGDGWALSGASVLPELRLGGEPLLDALEQELSR